MAAASRPLEWLTLALAQGLGRRLAWRIVADLGSPGAVLRAPRGRLVERLGAARADALRAGLCEARARRALGAARAAGQRVLTPAARRWPAARLAGLHDPPLALFAVGRRPPAAAPVAAIVGTREASHYGLAIARALGRDLVEAGVWVVSGMALGVDGAAHEGALEARATRGAATLAVLGTGADVAYPLAHLALRRRIAAQGGLLTEHPPGTAPERHHFPQRNRLVAALSDVVVVVEAPARSGALLTARDALELGRDVLAVPGPAGSGRHAGSHRLLREGAGLCEGAADVLRALRLDPERPVPPTAGAGPGAPLAEAEPLAAFLDPAEPLALDELCRRAGAPAREALLALARLESEGRVRRVGGGWQLVG